MSASTDAKKTDEQLLAEFLSGRQAAVGELARRYERPLLGLALGLLGRRPDLACDAVQETWVRVIRFGKQFMGNSSFKTWLYRIGLNQCRSLLHARGGGNADGPLDVLPAHGDGPEQAAQTTDRDGVLRDAVGQLDSDKRAVVLLCYHNGLTHEQAAEILEVPLGTLKSRLHAALTELRAALGAEASS